MFLFIIYVSGRFSYDEQYNISGQFMIYCLFSGQRDKTLSVSVLPCLLDRMLTNYDEQTSKSGLISYRPLLIMSLY